MGLRILHSADWHLDSPFLGFSEQQRQLLKEEQRKIPGKIADLCSREGCSMMLLAGDIFDGKASRETLDILKDALESTGVPVFISPGNHDFCGPDSVWVTENWPRNVHVFTGALEAVVVKELNCRVYGAAFQSMDCGSLLEDFRTTGEASYCVAVLHGDVVQKNSHYNPVTASQVRHSGLDYLALGHVHKAGAFRAGNTLCAWPGCPMGRGWDETGDKGACIVTLGRTAEVKAVALDTPRFYDLEADTGDGAEAALEDLLPGEESRDFYRITLTGSGKADIASLKARFSRFPNLELRDRTKPPVDVWQITDTDSLEGMFFSMLRNARDNDPEHADIIQLAAEISRQLLDGREVKL